VGARRESGQTELSGSADTPTRAAGGARSGAPSGRTLFVTGKLAAPALRATLASMAPDFEYEIAVMRITVAALMTTSWIARHVTEWRGRHLDETDGFERIVIPGLCEGDLRLIEDRLGIKAEKGPGDLRDLPEYFGQAAARAEYGGYDIRIFAEINNVPYLAREEVLRLARYYQDSGADVIDLGCSLDRKLPDVAELVALVKAHGVAVSIDTFDRQEILAADRGGVDYVLSVNGTNLEVAGDLHCTVVVIPDFGHGLETLDRNIAQLQRVGRPFIVDPIIEPIPVGFAAALDRYVQVRARYPAAEMLMGIGNITELTDADTTGVNALLIGFCQELGIRNVLTTEVIEWARGAVREVDVARRLMYAAHRRGVIPKHLDDRLLTVKDARPKYSTEPELRALQAAITDPNFRIYTTRDAICVFNNDLFVSGTDIQALFDQLGVEAPSHAFYLGKELMKARLALLLGKTYVQEQPLRWGYLTPEGDESRHGRVRLEGRKRR
jgi:dihydropteroate synthase